MARIIIIGDSGVAGKYLSWARSKLSQIKTSMQNFNRRSGSKRFIFNDAQVEVSSEFGHDKIQISGFAQAAGLFVADVAGWREYHGDLEVGHYRYGLKAFNKSMGLVKWFDPYSSMVPDPDRFLGGGLSYFFISGVSYYKNRIYTIDQNGYLDVFSLQGAHLEAVVLWTKVSLVGGKSQNAIHVRGDKIFVSANYLGEFYRVFEFDMAYNYIRSFPVWYGQGSWGSVAMAADVANNRLYIGQNGYYVGEHFDLLVHKIDTGEFVEILTPMGTEDIGCGGIAIYKGILYATDSFNRKIVRYRVATSELLDPIDCNPFLPSWMPLRAIVVDSSGIRISAGSTSLDPAERLVYIKLLSLDGLHEIQSVGEFMDENVPGTNPPKALRFGRPYWMDAKNTENP